MDINAKELEEYLKSALEAINRGVEGNGKFRINEPIEFNLAVTNVEGGEGGLKIYIANAKAEFKSEQISHIKIVVQPDRRSEAKVFGKASPLTPSG
ncbi:MAG: hypothetical protein HYW37_00545 [Candidatus Colwellbacteria bacterium]|nr:hypothetical protein [Candidatus Colwellbacteria bacterium]